MKFGSVCSGIEAASVAFGPLGWKAAWLAEIEPFPCAVLAHHYPEAPNLGDMTTIAARIDAGEVDAPEMLCGGTPCQAFSVAGLRRSLDDARGNLSLEFIRIADAIDRVRRAAGKPAAWVLWENVPGVLSTKDNAFGAFLGGLCGCDAALDAPADGWPSAGVVAGPSRVVAWRVLDAQFFGVAQRRKRVFVLALGGAGAWACADALLPVSDRMHWHPAPSREAGQRAAGTTAISVALRGREGGATAELGDDCGFGLRASGGGGDKPHILAFGGNNTGGAIDVAAGLNAKGGAGRLDFDSETFVTHSLRGDGFDASEDGTGRGTPLVPVGADCWNGALTGDVAATIGTRGSAETASGPTLLQAMQVRRLTPKECARLQGFPDEYLDITYRGKPAADGPKYKALGNSWAVPCVRWIGRRINTVRGAA